MKLIRALGLLCLSVSQSALGQQQVTLATLDWPPYIGPTLQNNGYVTEVVESAFNQVGYTADIEFMTWARAEHVTTEGYKDALFPEYFGLERTVTHTFSDPFPGGPVGFLKRIDRDISYQSLEDLTGYRIGVVRGYINTEEFDSAEFLTKEPVSSDLLNLRKLLRDRLDLVVIDKLVAQYILKKEMPDQYLMLEFIEPALENKDLYVAFSKQADGYQEKLEAFNKGLNLLKENGQLEAILARHGF